MFVHIALKIDVPMLDNSPTDFVSQLNDHKGKGAFCHNIYSTAYIQQNFIDQIKDSPEPLRHLQTSIALLLLANNKYYTPTTFKLFICQTTFTLYLLRRVRCSVSTMKARYLTISVDILKKKIKSVKTAGYIGLHFHCFANVFTFL